MLEHEQILEAIKAKQTARMGGFATTKERNAAIAEEYEKGSLSPAIAAKYAISRQRVWQILKARGVEPKFKTVASGEEIIRAIEENQLLSIELVAAYFSTTPNRIRDRVSRHSAWPDVRRKMREWRKESRRVVSRAMVILEYRALAERLGRPASIKEMVEAKIFTATLSRIYGNNYVKKFREDVGEVS
jgi:hypothetical protein